jgi:ABC-2 type transport system ATP-binding protein
LNDGIELCGVTKKIKENLILDNICLSLKKGEVYGFCGINGSGKTMLFRAIAGLIHLTEGEISVFSKRIGVDVSFPENLGIIIESVGFWPDYTGFENLKLLASIRNSINENQIEESLYQVGLSPKDTRKYKKYSLGQKQRLALAQAIMENPELLILDEPTNALDEEGIERFYSIIQKERERGTTVLIASHNKADLYQLCSRVYTLSAGKIVNEEIR